MTAHPILFSTPMIRALLDGRKSMTRRIVKPQPFLDAMGNFCSPGKKGQHSCWGQRIDGAPCTRDFVKSRCPYGVPGDLLWVRETFLPDPPADHSSWEDEGIATYVSWSGCGGALGDIPQALRTPSHVLYRATWKTEHKWQWRPAIHMPRWASRLTLEITDVRVERLQDISEEDAKAEGFKAITKDNGRTFKYGIPDNDGYPGNDNHGWDWSQWCIDPRNAYFTLWDKINGDSAHLANPWVWVLTFAVHHANVDAVLAQRAEVAA